MEHSDILFSAAGDWWNKATVRHADRRVLDPAQQHLNYFPQSLAPELEHPLVVQRKDLVDFRKRVLVQRFFQLFTTAAVLERRVIQPALDLIAECNDFDDQLRLIAEHIRTDESHHISCENDMIRQVAESTHILPLRGTQPSAITEISRIKQSAAGNLGAKVTVVAAIQVELLLGRTLFHLPQDVEVQSAIRDFVRDHAQDEAFHAQYFRRILCSFWNLLRPKERIFVGQMIPQLMGAIIEPDRIALQRILMDAGLPEAPSRKVIKDIYTGAVVSAQQKRICGPVLRQLREIGVMESTEVQEVFLRKFAEF